MRRRCLVPDCASYSNYGGRGITVCARWDSFANFLADMGSRPDGTTLDRRDVNGNYEPSNCRWADAKTQANNRRDRSKRYLYKGEMVTIRQIADREGINRSGVREKLRRPAINAAKLARRQEIARTKAGH